MSDGVAGFGRLLRLFRSSAAWTAGGATAVPFMAGLAGMAPPWPEGVVAITAIVQLLVLALAYQACQHLSKRTTTTLMLGGMLLLVLAGGAYLQQLSRHTYAVPTTGERFAKGSACTAEAEAVFPGRCPDLGMDALRTAEYEAPRLWTAASITRVRLRLLALWSLAFAALAWTLGTFFVHQMRHGVGRRGERPDVADAIHGDFEQAPVGARPRGLSSGGLAHAEVSPAPAPAARAPAPPAVAMPPSPSPVAWPSSDAQPGPTAQGGEADAAAPPWPMEEGASVGGDNAHDRWASASPPDDMPMSAGTEPAPPDDMPMSAGAEPAPEPAATPPGRGLLGGDAVSDTVGVRPAPADPERWINARLEDHAEGAPLRTGEVYTLAFGIDALRESNLGASGSAASLAPRAATAYALIVQLDSEDFDIAQPQRPLRIQPDGLSSGRARFDITPRRDGVGRISATFHKDGNFVQRMDLTLAIGTAAAVPIEVTSRGRPLTDLAKLRKRDIGISMEPAPGGGFDCKVWGSVQATATLPIRDGELADAIEQLRRALMVVVMHKDARGAFPFQDGLHIDADARDAALQGLAWAGYTLYRLLFHHPLADRQCKAIGDWLCQHARDARTVLNLQVVGEGFPVPWALLYLAERWDATALDWEGFLGMRHVVEQIPLQAEMGFVDCVIDEAAGGLAVSLNLNLDIDAQVNADVVQRQAAYWKQLTARRPTVRVTTRTQGSELLAALGNPATDDQIIYLFCHASAVGLGGVGGPNGSSLTLSTGKPLTLGELGLLADTDGKLRGHPLVFINACESGELSPLFYNGFVPYFMAKGARGVLGTECKMPALFAADWAQAFFDELLAGKPLGDTMLALRRRFLADHGNPLGLLYGLHCDADTQVVPAMPP